MYAVRVYFFDENQFGEVKLAIVPSDPYATYEDVHGCNEDVVEYGTALSQEEVALLRYYTSETSTVTFTTQANFDAYLYVIDPRSTESISPSGGAPSTFDDESAGNMQARIIKTLDPGVPYLVILCAYDPSWDSGLCYVSFE